MEAVNPLSNLCLIGWWQQCVPPTVTRSLCIMINGSSWQLLCLNIYQLQSLVMSSMARQPEAIVPLPMSTTAAQMLADAVDVN